MNNHNVADNESESLINRSIFGFPLVATKLKKGKLQLVLERIYNTYIHIIRAESELLDYFNNTIPDIS